MALSSPERALFRFAAAIALGGDARLASALEELRTAATPAEWVEELSLQALVVIGFPRTLVAIRAWRKSSGRQAPSTDVGEDYERHAEWTRAGERTCRVVYGANYERLRQAVRDLHPALDAWMITEGYGRTLSRPGLTLRQRELCMVAMVAMLDTPHQLHSHLRGALHAGADRDEIAAVLEAVLPDAPADAAASARMMWGRVGV